MTATENAPARTPIHLWIVGVVTLLWNAMGVYDYLMTETRNEAYMAKFTPEQLDYFYGYPAWAVAAWAIAVWGAVLGSVGLLLRKKFALPVYGVVFVAMLVSMFYGYVLSNGLEVVGGAGMLIFSFVIFLAAIGQLLYAKAMVGRGVLR